MSDYENHLIEFIKIQEKLKPSFALEIGAFEAFFSKEMAKIGVPSFAFEADPENFEHWSAVNTEELLTYINKAVSDVDGEVIFNKKEMDSLCGNNSILLKHDELLLDSENSVVMHKILVESVTVDTFIERNGLSGKPFSMWIDVEGICYEVLTKSLRNLPNCQSIYCETEAFEIWKGEKFYDELDEYIRSNGFVQVYKEDAYGGIQFDLIYVREDLVDRIK